MKTSANKNSVKNNQVINDFGQKIGGAHKDRAREAAERLRLADVAGLLSKPLAKVAKLPDLRGLYLSGHITAEAARRAWWLWAQIGPKPSGARGYRLQGWAERAAALIAAVADVLAYGLPEKSQLPDEFRPFQKWELFGEEMEAANWPADEYARGTYFVGPYLWGNGGYSIHNPKSSYYKRFETVAECVAAIREKVGGAVRAASVPKFAVYFSREAGAYYIAPAGKSGIKLAEVPGYNEGFDYIDTHSEELAAKYEELKKLPAERHDWNRPRVGADYRHGADLTPEAFAAVFPFRGVEFGNWVTQIERAACLNEAADALHDLAAVLGIIPEAVTLGGSLAWAFGSRGVGRAAAHYETARRVINLTKRKGNGCVAHEWFHALDHSIMVEAGRPLFFAVADGSRYGVGEKSPIFAAAADLKKALLSSPMYARSVKIDEFRSTPYWSTVTEMAARAFEVYMLGKLEAAGVVNDYLVSVIPFEKYSRPECYPYPTREEAAELAPLFDAFIMAAFGEGERVNGADPEAEAAQLPAPPAAVVYDPAQPVERAEFQTVDAEGVAYDEPEKSQICARLEEIRAAILSESVSYEEIAYLQEHADMIAPGDTLLLEWADVPEQPAPVAASEPMNAEEDEAPTPADGVQGEAYGSSEKSQNFVKPRQKSVYDLYSQYCRLRDELIKQCYPLNGVHLVRADRILEVYERYVNNVHKFMKSEEWDDKKPFIRELYMLYRRPDVATLNKSMRICELDETDFIDEDGKAHTYGRGSYGFFIPKKGWVSMPGDAGLPYNNDRETLKKIMDDGGYINFDGFQFVWPVMKGRDRGQKPVQPASIARKEWLEFKVHAMKVPFGCRQYIYEFIEKSLISAPEGVEWRIRHDSIWGIELKVDGVYFTVAYVFGRGSFYFDVVDVSSRFPSGICSPLSWCRYLDTALSGLRIPMSWPRPYQFYAVEYHLPFDDGPVFAG